MRWLRRGGWLAAAVLFAGVFFSGGPVRAEGVSVSLSLVGKQDNNTVRFFVSAEWTGRCCDAIPGSFDCYFYLDGNYVGYFEYGPCCEFGCGPHGVTYPVTIDSHTYKDISTNAEGTHVFTVTALGPGGASASAGPISFTVAAVTATTAANNGRPAACPQQSTANPVNVTTGNKWEEETDFELAGGTAPLTFIRMYNSQVAEAGPLGYGWSHNYQFSLAEIDTPFTPAGLSPGAPIPNLQESNNTFLILSHDESEALVPMILFKHADGRQVRLVRDRSDATLYASLDNLWTLRRLADGTMELKEKDDTRYRFDSSGQLLKILRSEGYEVDLAYEAGRLSQVSDSFGRALSLAYNGDGLLASVSDPAGRTFSYGYQGGNLTTVTQPDGRQVTYAYADPNDPHNLTSITDQNGHLRGSWRYDAQDRVVHYEREGGVGKLDYSYYSVNRVRLTNSLGRLTNYALGPVCGRVKIKMVTGNGCESCGSVNRQYNYDAEGNLVILYDGNSVSRAFLNYDTFGNPGTIWDAYNRALKRKTDFTYHPLYPALTLTKTTGGVLADGSKVVTYDYDSDGNDTPNENPGALLRRIVEEGRTRDLAGTVSTYRYATSLAYDALGQLTAIDGPRPGSADATALSYYPNEPDQGANRGLLQAATTPAGTTTYANYTSFGRPQHVVGPDGTATEVAYDLMGRVTDQTRAGRHTGYVYDGAGNLVQVSLPSGGLLAYTYDAADRLIQVADALGDSVEYTYDSEGNRTLMEVRDPAGTLKRSERYEYDANNRLSKVIQPSGAFRQFGYDANNNRTSLLDENGHTTTYTYDALNRLSSVVQPGSVTTGYAYDSNDDLVSVTDAAGHVTSYKYDDAGRLVDVLSPDTGEARYAFDEAGNLTARLDAAGVLTAYAYDPASRLTQVAYPDSRFNVGYGYDAASRLASMQDPSGSYAFGYDAAGELIAETKSLLGVNYTTAYAYNLDGVLTSITHPDGRIIVNSLDAAGRLSGVATTKGAASKTLAQGVAWLPFGPLASFSDGSGLRTDLSYDTSYRLTGLTAGSVLSLGYGHDSAGNITAITNALDPARSQTFGYDALDRLTSATGIYGSLGWTYDGVGNRLSETRGGQTDTYTYQAGTNRLAQLAGAATTSFAYDANGSTTQMGAQGFVYGQNTRLIQALSGGTVVGEYTYNGAGQRAVKTAGGQTTVFHYDQAGNLIGESKADGTWLSSFAYLNDARLARLDTPQEVTLRVASSTGQKLSGLPVYAFSEAGAYTGKSATTDGDGLAHFALSDLPEGSYKFRVDYLGQQLWSNVLSVPQVCAASLTVEVRSAEVSVTTAAGPAAGARVYLFSGGGSYLGLSGVTDEAGHFSFELPVGASFRFRADILGNQYWSDDEAISAEGGNGAFVAAGGGLLAVSVERGAGEPLAGVNTYLFSASGSYLGLTQATGAAGAAGYDVPAGMYQVRADYLGYQFWSEATQVSGDTAAQVAIPHAEVGVAVQGLFQGAAEPLPGLSVYLFTPGGSYLGQSRQTDTEGRTSFSLPERGYKVRADYLGQQFWSPEVTWQEAAVDVPLAEAAVTVTGSGLPLPGIQVYVFSAAGSYLGLHQATDVSGHVSFRLPAGAYQWRADYQGNQYWSGMDTLAAGEVNPVEVSTGGGTFALSVAEGAGEPLAGLNCYVFSAAGSYLGLTGLTDAAGAVSFNLADGTYKFRTDYLGYQLWSGPAEVPDSLELARTIPHQDVTVRVEGRLSGNVQPRPSVPVYLFTPGGSYLGLSRTTDSAGQASFHLPEQPYKVRADYLAQQFWSPQFTWQEAVVAIPEGTARVQVTQAGQGVAAAPVYVFSSGGSYLGLSALTDAGGLAEFRLPAGTYKLRADVQGNQYWATAGVAEDALNPVALSAGGGLFVLSVDTGQGPLANAPAYVFSTAGSYLGISGRTDAAGQVSFGLADGAYKFRVDSLGYQFWSDIYGVPSQLSGVFSIPQQDVTVTVAGLYQESEPLAGLNVYLFTPAGSYLGQSRTTDANGQAMYRLPCRDYKVRVDYLGQQFWSGVFQCQDAAVTINEGLASLHVTRSGADVAGAKVYLFTTGGSYLARFQTTDASGQAEFVLPDRAFKFRVDEGGHQYWSGVVNVIAGEENAVELDLDQLALIETNDPNPAPRHGTPPGVMLASLGSVQGLLLRAAVGDTPAAQVYYYHNDHLGTPQVVTDEGGQVVWRADYEPSGQANVTVSGIENSFRLPGQWLDQETGLHQNWFRDYAPGLGRYVEADPLGLGGGLNSYLYAESTPLIRTDRKGLQAAVLPGAGPFPPIRLPGVFYPGTPENKLFVKSVEDALALIRGYLNASKDDEDWRDRVDYDNWPTGQKYFHPKPPDPRKEKHKKAEEDCFDECEHHLGRDRCGQGFGYTNCMRDCMARHGFRYP